MKLKIFNYSVILILLIVFIGCKKDRDIDNELIITASRYTEGSVLPNQVNNFDLRVELMKTSEKVFNDQFVSYKYYDRVSDYSIKLTSDNGLDFGRYIISASQDSVKDVLEVIYKGGSIQVNLLMK